LYEFLSENSFYISSSLADVLEKVIKSKRRAVLLRGPAGTGKTHLTFLVSQWLGAEYVFYQCTYGTSEEDLLYKYIPSEETKSGIKITLGPVPRALSISRNRKVVLVLDEFDKTRPSADALLLDVLQNFRVSLYLDEKETVIAGDPDNLVIFLTSNDAREFSEPLLRRVVSVTLSSLPPEKVYELLAKRFRKEVALLLTQIYDDTIRAGLRKPATIQELYQLGEILEAGTSIALEDLLRMFIIKYDDDWKKFSTYVASRKAYEIFKKHDKKDEEDIAKYYEPDDEPDETAESEVEVNEDDTEKRNSAISILEKLKKFSVKRVEVVAEPLKIDDNVVEVTLKTADNDFEVYTYIIKSLKPEPTENPALFGKFELVESEIRAIISRKHLTVDEAFKLSKLSEVEGYYEDLIYADVDDVHNLIDVADKIKYYTNKTIYLLTLDENSEERVILEKISDISWRVRGYFKKSGTSSSLPLLEKISCKLHCDVKQLTKMLSHPRNSVYIDLSRISGYYSDDNVSAQEIVTIIENLRKSNIVDNVKFSVGEKDYNYYIIKEKDVLVIGIGFKYFDIVKTVAEVKKAYRYNINDSVVDNVIKALKSVM